MDLNAHRWVALHTGTDPRRPAPPFDIDPSACHEHVRHETYWWGSYPVARGTNALWIYDRERADGSTRHQKDYRAAIASTRPRNDRVLLFRNAWGRSGACVYDAEKNAWRLELAALPASLVPNRVVIVFHHPGLNANFIDVERDSQPGGRILVFNSNIGLQIEPTDTRKSGVVSLT